MSFYRIYCITEDEWVDAWANAPLTVCPNDASHTVNINSVKTVLYEEPQLNFLVTGSINTNSFAVLTGFYYQANLYGPIRILNALVWGTGTVGSFDIQIFDVTNNNILSTTTLTNVDSTAMQILNPITNQAMTDSYIEIWGQIDTGVGTVNISQFLIRFNPPEHEEAVQ